MYPLSHRKKPSNEGLAKVATDWIEAVTGEPVCESSSANDVHLALKDGKIHCN